MMPHIITAKKINFSITDAELYFHDRISMQFFLHSAIISSASKF